MPTGEESTAELRRLGTKALEEELAARGADFLRFLEEEVWPNAPEGQLGRRLSRVEEDEILGYGSEGV